MSLIIRILTVACTCAISLIVTAQDVSISRQILLITPQAESDVLKDLIRLNISPITLATTARLQIAPPSVEGSQTTLLTKSELHRKILEITLDDLADEPITEDRYIEILLDPGKQVVLPLGTVVIPKAAKDLFDPRKGQLIEEKIRVLEKMKVVVPEATRLAIGSCSAALFDYRVALGANSPGNGASAASGAELRDKAERELDAKCLDMSLQSDAATAFGVLEADGRVFCGALLLSASRIATAFHCLVRTDIDRNTMRFRPLSNPQSTFELGPLVLFPGQAKLSKFERSRIENDFIGAELKTPVPTPPNLCFDHPVVKGAPLSLVAYWDFARAAGTLSDSVRIEKSGGCLVLTDVTGCFAHSCSTLPDQSGSPVFAAIPGCGGAHVAGLHVNGETEQTACGALDTNSAVSASRLALLLPVPVP